MEWFEHASDMAFFAGEIVIRSSPDGPADSKSAVTFSLLRRGVLGAIFRDATEVAYSVTIQI